MLNELAQIFFFTCSKIKYVSIFDICVYQKGRTANFPLSFVAVFGSGIRDPGSRIDISQDSRSGINIRSTTLLPNKKKFKEW
jgi:hypothetical protein